MEASEQGARLPVHRGVVFVRGAERETARDPVEHEDPGVLVRRDQGSGVAARDEHVGPPAVRRELAGEVGVLRPARLDDEVASARPHVEHDGVEQPPGVVGDEFDVRQHRPDERLLRRGQAGAPPRVGSDLVFPVLVPHPDTVARRSISGPGR
ncbi:hypothetical protein QOL16_00120 [Curtobacterium sp. MCBA15_004]|nr:hypothetical protein [Curtobacterium sp. MCBA15_004]WIA96829.1 hypothetical protein QOL16_00120 [Curtobacterium sp. MCBA15_004]